MPKTKTVAPAIELLTLPLDDLDVQDGFNPRTSIDDDELRQLADSIGRHGLLQPVIARPGDGKYLPPDGVKIIKALAHPPERAFLLGADGVLVGVATTCPASAGAPAEQQPRCPGTASAPARGHLTSRPDRHG